MQSDVFTFVVKCVRGMKASRKLSKVELTRSPRAGCSIFVLKVVCSSRDRGCKISANNCNSAPKQRTPKFPIEMGIKGACSHNPGQGKSPNHKFGLTKGTGGTGLSCIE